MDDAHATPFEVVLYIADESTASEHAVRNLMRWLRDVSRREVRWSIRNVSHKPLAADDFDRVVAIPTLVVRAPVACQVAGDLRDLDAALARSLTRARRAAGDAAGPHRLG